MSCTLCEPRACMDACVAVAVVVQGGLAQSSTCRAGLSHKLGMLASKDTWTDDAASASCQLCQAKFGMISNRKHHVRSLVYPDVVLCEHRCRRRGCMRRWLPV